jgi:hypothetical protein
VLRLLSAVLGAAGCVPPVQDQDISYPQRNSGGVGHKRYAFGLRLPEGQREVGRLELVGIDGARWQT